MDHDRRSRAVACNLAAADRQDRLAWIKQLNAAALCHYRRLGPRVKLTYAASAAALVREFVRREQKCCPFLDFTFRSAKNALTLVIEVPEDAVESADALFATYTTTSPSSEA